MSLSLLIQIRPEKFLSVKQNGEQPDEEIKPEEQEMVEVPVEIEVEEIVEREVMKEVIEDVALPQVQAMFKYNGDNITCTKGEVINANPSFTLACTLATLAIYRVSQLWESFGNGSKKVLQVGN